MFYPIKKTVQKSNQHQQKQKITSFQRVKTWRNPITTDLSSLIHSSSINKPSAEQKYNQICQMLMFNYFDKSAFGGFINKNKELKNPGVKNLSQNEILVHEILKRNVENNNEENYTDTQEIMKLQRMAQNIKTYEKENIDQNSMDQNLTKLTKTGNQFRRSNNLSAKTKTEQISRAQTHFAKKRKGKKQTSTAEFRIPIIALLKGEEKDQGEIEKNKQKNKIKKLKKQIDELQNEAITSCGMKFTKIKEQNFTESQQKEQQSILSEKSQAEEIQILKNANFQQFQNRFIDNFPCFQKNTSQSQNHDSTIPPAFLSLLKTNSQTKKRSQLYKNFTSKNIRPPNYSYLKIR